MPHPLRRIKLCAIIRWSLQQHYKNPPPDALGVGEILHLRREGPYTYIIKSESDLRPNILKSGPISNIGIRSIPLLRIQIQVPLSLGCSFGLFSSPPPNELVCMLLWRMCIVVTSTMLYPLTLVLLSLLVRPFLKYRLTNYISCFPPTICFACESRCKPSKFSNFVLIFNTPILRTKKKWTLSHKL